MKAAATQQVQSRKNMATGAALQKAANALNTLREAFSNRLQYAVSAFHDTVESRKYSAAEAQRLSQTFEMVSEEERIAALLLCTTTAKVIALREGLNHFKATEQGIRPATREEYLRSQTAWEIKVEGDQVQVWTLADTRADLASTNDIVTALNGNFFVKVIPFELRGSVK